jgi:predicted RNA binding protein YcfA (HicA-like mRNA interferase family)
MAALPSVSGERAVAGFPEGGGLKDRQRGSHVILIKPGHATSLSVPQHREIAPGALRVLDLRVPIFVKVLGVHAQLVCGREIWVIADAQGYQSSLMERRSHGVGQEYHLVPFALPHGVFHPKCCVTAMLEKRWPRLVSLPRRSCR